MSSLSFEVTDPSLVLGRRNSGPFYYGLTPPGPPPTLGTRVSNAWNRSWRRVEDMEVTRVVNLLLNYTYLDSADNLSRSDVHFYVNSLRNYDSSLGVFGRKRFKELLVLSLLPDIFLPRTLTIPCQAVRRGGAPDGRTEFFTVELRLYKPPSAVDFIDFFADSTTELGGRMGGSSTPGITITGAAFSIIGGALTFIRGLNDGPGPRPEFQRIRRNV